MYTGLRGPKVPGKLAVVVHNSLLVAEGTFGKGPQWFGSRVCGFGFGKILRRRADPEEKKKKEKRKSCIRGSRV